MRIQKHDVSVKSPLQKAFRAKAETPRRRPRGQLRDAVKNGLGILPNHFLESRGNLRHGRFEDVRACCELESHIAHPADAEPLALALSRANRANGSAVIPCWA